MNSSKLSLVAGRLRVNCPGGGVVNIPDGLGVRQALFTSPGDANYSMLFDFAGSGTIDIADGQALRQALFTSLPTTDPTSTPCAASLAQGVSHGSPVFHKSNF
jgi:hypothetical protein